MVENMSAGALNPSPQRPEIVINENQEIVDTTTATVIDVVIDYSPTFYTHRPTLRPHLAASPMQKKLDHEKQILMFQAIRMLEETVVVQVSLAPLRERLKQILKERNPMPRTLNALAAALWNAIADIAEAVPPPSEFVNILRKHGYAVDYPSFKAELRRFSTRGDYKERLVKYVRWYATRIADNWREVVAAVYVAERIARNGFRGTPTMIAKLIIAAVFSDKKNIKFAGRGIPRAEVEEFLRKYKQLVDEAWTYAFSSSSSGT